MISAEMMREHEHYLCDAHRLAAYQRALDVLVRPGDVVLDLGCGSGILGILALRAGAEKVFAVDHSSMLGVARAIARANGFEESIEHVSGFSRHVELPRAVDLVVGDQVSYWGYEAGLLGAWADAGRRHLAPEGRIVPSAVQFRIAAVESAALYAPIEFWSGRPMDLDTDAVRACAVGAQPRAVTVEADALLTDVGTAGEIELGAVSDGSLVLSATLTVARDGTLHALAGWFRARLAPGIWMTNAPGDDERVDRPVALLPVDPPLAVSEGDRVEVRAHVLGEGTLVAWKVVLRRGDGSVQRREHSTLDAEGITSADLTRSHPQHQPELLPLRAAWQYVLGRCDGATPVLQLRADVREAFPKLFPTPGDAQGFVDRVLRATE